MHRFHHSLITYSLIIIIINTVDSQEDPDAKRNVTQLIESKGYYCEEHKVITDDGFILSVQRMMNNHNVSERKQAVLLIHGLSDSADTWVINLANQSLGYILADAGYDVWLGNMRGNRYSRQHKTLNINDVKFWDFSMDELSKYDLPAMINYVVNVTNQSQIYYIGDSQGTTIAFAEFSSNQELSTKIKLFIAMGAATTIGYTQSIIKNFIGPPAITNVLFKVVFGEREFLPDNELSKRLGIFFCDKNRLAKFCENVFVRIYGPFNDINETRVPVYFNHYPSGTSTKNIIHTAQMIYTKRFQMYDYASNEKNFEKYKQNTPPLYNLENVNVPVAIFSSGNDYLANSLDIQVLRDILPNIVFDFLIDEISHIDFILGLQASRLVYPNILQIMKEFS